MYVHTCVFMYTRDKEDKNQKSTVYTINDKRVILRSKHSQENN